DLDDVGSRKAELQADRFQVRGGGARINLREDIVGPHNVEPHVQIAVRIDERGRDLVGYVAFAGQIELKVVHVARRVDRQVRLTEVQAEAGAGRCGAERDGGGRRVAQASLVVAVGQQARRAPALFQRFEARTYAPVRRLRLRGEQLGQRLQQRKTHGGIS